MRGATPTRNATARSVLNTASNSVKSGSASSTRQPIDSKTSRSASTTARTRRSTGAPPSVVHHATRTPSKSRASGAAKHPPGSASAIGDRESGPAIALSISARSAAVRAIGPSTLSVDQPSAAGHVGTRPGDGRSPTTPQKLAGLRSEPPMSLPSAIGSMPAASAAAAPPLLPPHVFVSSYGFSVAPNTVLNVCEPAPNSGVLVLPTAMAPAVRSRSTMSASSSGTNALKIGDPKVVRMPRVGCRSLCATGSPCSGPTAAPRANASSARAARSIARSASSVTIALSRGLRSAMRSRCAATTSRAETSFRCSRRASSSALRSQRFIGPRRRADPASRARGSRAPP